MIKDEDLQNEFTGPIFTHLSFQTGPSPFKKCPFVAIDKVENNFPDFLGSKMVHYSWKCVVKLKKMF